MSGNAIRNVYLLDFIYVPKFPRAKERALTRGGSLSVLSRDRRNERDVHMRRLFVHVNDRRHHELLPADLVHDKSVGVAKEISRSFLSELVEELFVRSNHELAENGALLLAREPQIAFQVMFVSDTVELFLVAVLPRLFQVIIQASA